MNSSTSFHESPEKLKAETCDRHRAIASIMEELEAVDWYAQRIDAASDDALREILRHNRDEEKEHAAMMIEWLRRNDPQFHDHLKDYLFTDDPIVGIEEASTVDGAGAEGDGECSLGIGSLRGSDPA